MNLFCEKVNQCGWDLVTGLYRHEELNQLSDACASLAGDYGARNVLECFPGIRPLLFNQSLLALLAQFGCNETMLVRSLFFNKIDTANWLVTWHQDSTITVQQRHQMPGFSKWTLKDKVQHVEPPRALLESMIALRINLDAADERNGALQVLPATHLLGKLDKDAIGRCVSAIAPHRCDVQAGDVLVMKPLLLHASKKSVSGLSRRVIHLEFCPLPLPEPLRWAKC